MSLQILVSIFASSNSAGKERSEQLGLGYIHIVTFCRWSGNMVADEGPQEVRAHQPIS
jgi:hypothetical protein